MKYKDELIRSMEYLAGNPNTIFLGQSVAYTGNAIYNTLSTISNDRKIETPVFEDVQMGMSMGLALGGFIPVTCYPRFDFLICAVNQMINHIDKANLMSRGQMKPRVIIRTSIGSKKPLNGGVQHTQDYTDVFKGLCRDHIEVVLLNEPEEIFPAFQKALLRKDSKSTLLIEHGDYYNDK
jgi:pyruvate/2-oxoglutarate/acetoin dehydrogenase E1 component